ncbi:MAG: hypothetical protein UW46_C0001G0064 [Candidatus Yanofskybacteria bacterium GW2011_GWF1_44_227]|uniref:Uncharacterized protein n=1 Tax=Candidatus Yanofskybacteria bacterium GW2011_GWE2_40_11 TaxID=1619033 RepID=A0A0G0TSG4_9BACT|nr:MAG: hypothetical protein UT69_C0025G0008 [Candidatus Yanofskybacteria bacterium GW2011_GWE1_40_10]KKR40797.1 MAG: hypothetical protein UT75_C0004G0008 [Candidatus Yanofskybacteria bacterium GW2011_GWE2_40_11]KKT15912.1 MAG: hypothetical protein UV97_C0001G0085 [Candidatus Yanofskybacteria bacterium GW2011_GWF2_43_596]KKT53574.1 MAG: hypothetical protein UW46_C0001G0064 [Candidatus Yanofskybacteria bacterium GW2011_GWF1_44_227]OGN36099.1 MAG: hypothetical protein A2207_03510 [Candidatus Yano
MFLWFLLIFLLCIAVDGLIGPALYGAYFNFLVITYLASCLLVFGPRKRVFIFLPFFSILYELILGYPLGSIILPMSLIILVLFGMDRIISFNIFSERSGYMSFIAMPILGLALTVAILIISHYSQQFISGESLNAFKFGNHLKDYRFYIHSYIIIAIEYFLLTRIFNIYNEERL